MARGLALVLAVLGVVFLGSLASPSYAVDCSVDACPTVTDTATVTATATETTTATTTATETATATTTATATVTAVPTPIATSSVLQRTGYYVDPASGSVMVTQGSGVAFGVLVFIVAVIGGLATGFLVLP